MVEPAVYRGAAASPFRRHDCVCAGGPARSFSQLLLAPYSMLAAASVIALVVWFISAPSVRFGYMYFWILCACAATMLLDAEVAGRLRFVTACATLTVCGAGLMILNAGPAVLQVPRQFQSGMLVFAVISMGLAIGFAVFTRPNGLPLRATLLLVVGLGVCQTADRLLAHGVQAD